MKSFVLSAFAAMVLVGCNSSAILHSIPNPIARVEPKPAPANIRKTTEDLFAEKYSKVEVVCSYYTAADTEIADDAQPNMVMRKQAYPVDAGAGSLNFTDTDEIQNLKVETSNVQPKLTVENGVLAVELTGDMSISLLDADATSASNIESTLLTTETADKLVNGLGVTQTDTFGDSTNATASLKCHLETTAR